MVYIVVFGKEVFVNFDGVVKNLHLLCCCIFYLIATYLGTPKSNEKYTQKRA